MNLLVVAAAGLEFLETSVKYSRPLSKVPYLQRFPATGSNGYSRLMLSKIDCLREKIREKGKTK